jgi:hypothetical protein
MHATAIATAAEFVSGLNVLEVFDMAGYRLIMSRLEVDYLRRPIGHCYAESKWDEPTLNAVRQDINDEGVSSFVLKSIVTDSKNEKIAEATIHWQVKSWKKVRVK